MNGETLKQAYKALINDDDKVIQDILSDHPTHARPWHVLSDEERLNTYTNVRDEHFYTIQGMHWGLILREATDSEPIVEDGVVYGFNRDPVEIATIADVAIALSKLGENVPHKIRAVLRTYDASNATVSIEKLKDNRLVFHITGRDKTFHVQSCGGDDDSRLVPTVCEGRIVFDSDVVDHLTQGKTLIAQAFDRDVGESYHPSVIADSDNVVFLEIGDKYVTLNSKSSGGDAIVFDRAPLDEAIRASVGTTMAF